MKFNNNINIELRSEILEYSLILEKYINELLLLNLGIMSDSKATRLFGSKAGITFKNKIDLLFDIDVLSKDENSDMELLMIFRNKFLHIIDCDSFKSVISELDNGLKNKFKCYLPNGHSIDNEESCKTACSNLFMKNIKVIHEKAKERREKLEEKNEIFQVLNNGIISHLDLFFDLINDLYLILENSELENDKVLKLSEKIFEKCNLYVNKYQEDENFVSLNKNYEKFFADNKRIYRYLGITKMDKNNEITTFSDSNLAQEIGKGEP